MSINKTTLNCLDRDIKALEFFSDFNPEDKIAFNRNQDFEKKLLL
jgi:hypothetical protein